MSKGRSGQWFGNSVLLTLETTATDQVQKLLPEATALESIRDLVFERSIVSFQTRRILANTVEGCAYVVWHGGVDPATGDPLQTFDPLSQDSFVWANKNIMRFGPLPVQPVVMTPSTDTQIANREISALQIDFDVKRSIARANEAVFIAVAADVAATVKCLVTWRTYYTYA